MEPPNLSKNILMKNPDIDIDIILKKLLKDIRPQMFFKGELLHIFSRPVSFAILFDRLLNSYRKLK